MPGSRFSLIALALVAALAGGCSKVRYANTVATVPKVPAVALPGDAKSFAVVITPELYNTEANRQRVAIPGFERTVAADADIAVAIAIGNERCLSKDYMEHRPDKGPQGFLGTYKVRRDYTITATPKGGAPAKDNRQFTMTWNVGNFDGPLYATPGLVDAAYDASPAPRVIAHVDHILADCAGRLADTYGKGSEQVKVALAGVEAEPRFQPVAMPALDLVNRYTADQRPDAAEWKAIDAAWTEIKTTSTVPEAPGAAAYNLGITRYVRGDYDAALADLQEAARLNPEDESIRNVLAFVTERARRAKAAK